MELLCPECMGTLQIADGTTARCLTHGGEYQVLFSHWQPTPVAEAPVAPPVIETGTACGQHPNVPAIAACPRCGIAICDTCAFSGTGGRKVCLQCIPFEPRPDPYAPVAPPPPVIPAEARCVQHPASAATQQCKLCRSYMCPTCDFLMPGNYHLCPKCATAPRAALSPRRKKCLIGSFAAAIFATFGMVIMMSGALAGMVHSKADYSLVGTVCMFLCLIPAIIGMSLGFSAIDKRLVNPLTLWVATIWNALIVGLFILLMIVGMLR